MLINCNENHDNNNDKNYSDKGDDDHNTKNNNFNYSLYGNNNNNTIIIINSTFISPSLLQLSPSSLQSQQPRSLHHQKSKKINT